MASCSSLHSRRRSRASSGGTWSGRPAACVPSSLEKVKKPAQSSWAAAQELEEQVVVALGLAGVTEDEGGTEGGVGRGGADVADAAHEALAVAPTPHAGEERARHVLEREVEVGDAGIEDGADQLVGEAGRVQIEQPRAFDAGGHGPGERGDRRGAAGGGGAAARPGPVRSRP